MVHASSIKEAIDFLSRTIPDAIFLDNKLIPYMNYKETVPLLREAGYEGKIVVVTVDSNDVAFADAHEFTVHRYVEKFDFNMQNFGEKVAEVLS